MVAVLIVACETDDEPSAMRQERDLVSRACVTDGVAASQFEDLGCRAEIPGACEGVAENRREREPAQRTVEFPDPKILG